MGGKGQRVDYGGRGKFPVIGSRLGAELSVLGYRLSGGTAVLGYRFSVIGREWKSVVRVAEPPTLRAGGFAGEVASAGVKFGLPRAFTGAGSSFVSGICGFRRMMACGSQKASGKVEQGAGASGEQAVLSYRLLVIGYQGENTKAEKLKC